MSSRETRVWDAPEATKLATLLDDVTSQFDLNKDYTLNASIYGLKPLPDTKSEIEQRFGCEIDPSAGSTIGLYLHQKTGRLVLNRLSVPIIHDDGPGASVNLLRDTGIPSSYYHSYILLPNRTVIPSESTLREGWQNGLSTNILNGYGIETQPENSDIPYRMWFGAHILHRAKTWDLVERMQLDRTEGGVAQIVSVTRSQKVPENACESTLSLSVLRETVRSTKDRNIVEEEDQLSLVIHEDVERFVRNTQNFTVEEFEDTAEIGDIVYFANVLQNALKNRSA